MASRLVLHGVNGIIELYGACGVCPVIVVDVSLVKCFLNGESENAEIKLIDFGFSRQYLTRANKMTKLVGTCYYLAPEVLKASTPSEACVACLCPPDRL